MTLQEFIAVWQAQPFRAFRLHAAACVHDVAYPAAVALLPDLRVIVAAGEAGPVPFPLEAVERIEVHGPALSLAEVFAGIPPEVLARDAQRLNEAQQAAIGGGGTSTAAAANSDPGRVELTAHVAADGEWVVHATMTDAQGRELLRTTGMQWNVHGVAPFENGTALFLHHPGDPSWERRVILWPPDRGTLESFAESRTVAELRSELERLDRRLTAKPTRPREPTAAYFKRIHPEYAVAPGNPMAELFGDEAGDPDLDRYEFHLVARTLSDGTTVENPCLVDVPGEDFFFNLTETAWDADFVRRETTFDVGLRYRGERSEEVRIAIDPVARTAVVAGDGEARPVGFVQRALLNYALHENWPALRALLRAGPPAVGRPEIELSLGGGHRVEFWPGERHFPLPFLQPRFVGPEGHALLDFRGTAWAVRLEAEHGASTIDITLVSHERDASRWAREDRIVIGLTSRRVTVSGRSGATTVGMIQAMIRHVRGVQWLREDLAASLEKGRMLPSPGESAPM